MFHSPPGMTTRTIAFTLISVAALGVTARYLGAQGTGSHTPLEPAFEQTIKPFFQQNCIKCHNSDVGTAGVRVDQLDAKLEDRSIPTWEAILHRVRGGTMPPKGLPQPPAAERQKVVEWVGTALEQARM